jgi:hypothetical protein
MIDDSRDDVSSGHGGLERPDFGVNADVASWPTAKLEDDFQAHQLHQA